MKWLYGIAAAGAHATTVVSKATSPNLPVLPKPTLLQLRSAPDLAAITPSPSQLPQPSPTFEITPSSPPVTSQEPISDETTPVKLEDTVLISSVTPPSQNSLGPAHDSPTTTLSGAVNLLTATASPPLSPSVTNEAPDSHRAPMPVRLTIPALAVDAPIASVGLDANGFMAAPDTAEVAGWYKLGPRPGEPSNAIIAGHVDWLGEKGVFSRLHTLQTGDVVEIHSQAGVSFRYVVDTLHIYQNDTAPVAEIFGGTSESMLTLITCTGPYDTRTAEYRDRLVIRAKAIR